jgi:hypothetical protein
MASERETRTETDFWGNEHQYIYENGKRVGEYKIEDRGGFLGIGDESQKVEYDSDDKEVGYSRQERRGGFLGIGDEEVEAGYERDGRRSGYSRVEERGGILGIGSHHARIGYDEDGNEVSSTQRERRGGILGVGERHARVTSYTEHGRRTRSDHDSSSADGSGWEEALGKIVVGGLVIVAIVWLVLAVVIPLAIINSAVLALIAAGVTSKRRTTLYIVSVCGALYALVDYNAGGLTRNLGATVPFLREWVSIFVYANISAGLIPAYFLLQPVLANAIPTDEEHRARQQLILASCLVALGCAILAAQWYVDLRWQQKQPPEASAPSTDQSNEAVGVSPYQAPVSQSAPAQPSLPHARATKEPPSTSIARDAPERPGRSVAGATVRHSGERRHKEPSLPAPVAPRAIDCVLPDGQETRVTAERCESAGGMEYR